MVIGLTTYKSVNGFTDEQLNLMRAFLQGAVYCWCKNRKDEWFAARDLLGGDNYYWQGTPLRYTATISMAMKRIMTMLWRKQANPQVVF